MLIVVYAGCMLSVTCKPSMLSVVMLNGITECRGRVLPTGILPEWSPYWQSTSFKPQILDFDDFTAANLLSFYAWYTFVTVKKFYSVGPIITVYSFWPKLEQKMKNSREREKICFQKSSHLKMKGLEQDENKNAL
jgi:hypothetical protein